MPSAQTMKAQMCQFVHWTRKKEAEENDKRRCRKIRRRKRREV